MRLEVLQFVRLTRSDTPHRHTRYAGAHEFHCCVAGRGIFLNEERASPFTPGAVCLAGPGERHGVMVRGPASPVSFYYVIFRIAGAADTALIRRLGGRFAEAGSLHLPAYAPEFLARMKEHAGRGPEGAACAAQMLRALVHELLATPESKAPRHPAVDRAIRAMRARIGEHLTLEQLAAEVSLDPSYLVRLFRRDTGRPPLKYFAGLKIDSARYLLANGNLSIAEVAARLGYCDEYHFSRAFRRETGSPPGRFRQRHTA